MRAALPALVLGLLGSGPARAQQAPEQLEQLEPDAGAWQAEYAFGRGEETAQQLQLMRGLDDHLALGGEIEFRRERGATAFDSLGLAALWRGAEARGARIGWGIKAQASLGRDGRPDEAELRLITEARPKGWWLQGDAMLRRVREDDGSALGIAYALSAQRRAGAMGFGAEFSGRLTRVGGDADLFPAAHYAGPALSISRGAVEISAAWLLRIAGQGARRTPRVAIQIGV